MAQKKIVLVSTVPPVPFSHYPVGGRWTYVLLKTLSARGHRVTCFAPYADPKQEEEARALFPKTDFDLRLHPMDTRSGLLGKWRTLREPAGYLFGPELRGDLESRLSEPWDVLHLEDAWSGWLGLSCDRRKAVLNYYNLYRIDDQAFPAQTWKAALQSSLRKRAEVRLARAYPNIMALTPRLASELKTVAPSAAVSVCPLGLDLERYPFIPARSRQGSHLVGLIGSMSWGPTRQAAERLLSRLWPALSQRLPSARCQVIGWQARQTLRKYLGMPRVDILENVPDTRPYFERMDVMLYAPQCGSGLKVKVLEAFAYGVPVVTTLEGLEGIPAVDGVQASTAEEDQVLVEKTLKLLLDPARQEAQRQAARALIETHFSPRASVDAVEKVYATLSRAAS